MKNTSKYLLVSSLIVTTFSYTSDIERKTKAKDKRIVTFHTATHATAVPPQPAPTPTNLELAVNKISTKVADMSKKYTTLTAGKKDPGERAAEIAARIGDIEALNMLFAIRPKLKDFRPAPRPCLAAEACVYGRYFTACRLCGDETCCRCCYKPLGSTLSIAIPNSTPAAHHADAPQDQLMTTPAPTLESVEKTRNTYYSFPLQRSALMAAVHADNINKIIELLAIKNSLKYATNDAGLGLITEAYMHDQYCTACRLIGFRLRDKLCCCICCCCC